MTVSKISIKLAERAMMFKLIHKKNIPQNLVSDPPEEVIHLCPRCRRQSTDEYQNEEITPNCMRFKQKGKKDLEIMLTPMEAELISTLLAHEGLVITNDRLIYNLYHNGTGQPYRQDSEPENPINSIRVVLNRIRHKFSRHNLPIVIKTVYGIGLKMTAPKNQITMECV